MTIAVMKTKAETALSELFKAQQASAKLVGENEPERAAAFAAFEKLGMPSRRVEEWKYTDLRARFTEAFPPAKSIPETQAHLNAGRIAGIDALRLVFLNGKLVHWVQEGPAGPGFTLAVGLPDTKAEDATVGLTAALADKPCLIRITETPPCPLHFVFVTDTTAPMLAAVSYGVEIAAGTVATIIESHVALGNGARQTFVLADLKIGDGAQVGHIKIKDGKAPEIQIATWRASIGAHANYRAFQFTASNGLTRNQLFVTYAGEHAKLDISGVMLGRNSDHIDTTLVVDHAVPHCESRELFKIVLDDRARGIFQGKVIVRQYAQKSDGKQMANALMLSEDAEFDSKPELEIYADDVVCGHGATCAELDENLIFYCQSRGIPLPEARALLIESFIGEALEKLEHEGIRDTLRAVALEWLDRK
jgi:Fe-S cluster assembly protein SufD